jgi:hypothetical protein
MATKPKTITKHILAVLNFPTRNANKIRKAENILMSMTGNSNFTTPVPALATVQIHVDTLNKSQAAALSRGMGAVAQRDVDLEVVHTDLKSLRLYVQAIADASPDKAIEIIESAGFSAKKTSTRTKPDLAVKNGNDTGTVILIARGGGPRSAHEWQMSKDQINWTDLPVTIAAKTRVLGLVYGTTAYFRHRIVTKSGSGPYTNPVGVLVS